MFERIINFFKALFGLKEEKGEPYSNIKFEELYGILKNQLGIDSRIYLADSIYNLTSVDKLKEILIGDDTDNYVYRNEYFDCDDFSFRLMGQLSTPEYSDLAFGILWVGSKGNSGHALNIFVDEHKDVYIVEPQTDEIWEAKYIIDKRNYKPWFVIM